jgi:DNA-binding CsgD family transcriptional regulator
MFGLSAAEARAAAGIAAGQNPAAIAAARGVSIETVRAQLKLAMAKMGVHTQAQLAVTVCRVAGLGRAPE